MKICIISDTHNDEYTLAAFLELLRQQQITTIIHCGDLTSPVMASHFTDFQLFLAYGNGDYQTGEIKAQLDLLGTGCQADLMLQLNIDGIAMAAIHGNAHHLLQKLLQSGSFQYIFTGHTHVQNDVVVNQTRIINPGAFHTKGYHTPTYALLDTASRELEFHRFIPSR